MARGRLDPVEVGIIGPYPPPRGELAVHLERLVPRLVDQGLAVRHYNLSTASAGPHVLAIRRRRGWWMLRHLGRGTDRLLHVHGLGSAALGFLFAAVARKACQRYLLSVHDTRDLDRALASAPLKRFVMSYLGGAERVHAVDTVIAEKLESLGVHHQRIVIYPLLVETATGEPAPADPFPEIVKMYREVLERRQIPPAPGFVRASTEVVS